VNGQGRRYWIAGSVTIAGVVAIWAISMQRQASQTSELSRVWRGEGEEAIAARLRALAVEAWISESPERWPDRCAPLFSTLRVDRSILRGDPRRSVETLEVLAPRVFAGDPSLEEVLDRARELAQPIALLDEVMPSGAEYDPERYERRDRGVDPEMAIRSTRCPSTEDRERPFLHAELEGRRLYDAVGTRALIATADGGVELRTQGQDVVPLDASGLRFPRLVGLDRVAWLDAVEPALHTELRSLDRRVRTELPIAEPADALAICESDRALSLALLVDGEIELVRIETGRRAQAPIRVAPRPPRSGTLFACSETSTAFVWRRGDVYRGSVCDARRCRAMPSLRAGPGLRIGVAGDRLLALAPRAGSDVALVHTLDIEGELRWSEPSLGLRGELWVRSGRFQIASCAGALMSNDGARWEPYFDP
jgi:hypothetical protein